MKYIYYLIFNPLSFVWYFYFIDISETDNALAFAQIFTMLVYILIVSLNTGMFFNSEKIDWWA